MTRIARHSSKSSGWQTPPFILEPARIVLGSIDLDPASCAQANKTVKAKTFFTPERNGLARPWSHMLVSHVRWCVQNGKPIAPTSIWLNPPGGWHKGRVGDSEIKHWWIKSLQERREPYFGHMLWLSFSIEALQVTQVECEYSLCHFPTVIFSRRVPYIDPKTGKAVSGNTHASSITYIPGRLNRTKLFFQSYAHLGIGVGPIDWERLK